MELKRRFNYRKVFVVFYVLCFLVYLAFGLQPAEASQEFFSQKLEIPSINLETPVAELELVDRELETPDKIAGSFSIHKNKTLIIGHSTTVFENLKDVRMSDILYYNDKLYEVYGIETLAKNDISMSKIMAAEENDTLVLMTCAGELLDGGDATHRLIIRAVKLF